MNILIVTTMNCIAFVRPCTFVSFLNDMLNFVFRFTKQHNSIIQRFESIWIVFDAVGSL